MSRPALAVIAWQLLSSATPFNSSPKAPVNPPAATFFEMTPYYQYFPMTISIAVWLLSIFLFYEGISFHQEAHKFSIFSRRALIGTMHLGIYSGIVTLFYCLIFVRITASWHATNMGQIMTIILFHDPLIFAPGLTLLSLYPSMSAMLRFSGLDYDYSSLPVDHSRNKFAAKTGFFLSLAIFVISITIISICFIEYFKP